MIVLTPGVRYRVTHKTDGQRYARESVMEYMGRVADVVQFSARPVAGTQMFFLGDIIAAEPVDRNERVYMNRRAP